MIPRREPQAIILSHKMDPERKEVYVEGRSDRLFLLWIAGDGLHHDVLVHEIATIELSDQIEGGERGRLIHFAEMVRGQALNILFFSDADYDRLFDRIDALPPNVTLTDGRDTEAYFLRRDCFEKIVKLAIRTDKYSGEDLLSQITLICRELASIRIYSELNGLSLPFQRTQFRKYISFTGYQLRLDLKSYIGALLQNADLSLSMTDAIYEGFSEVQRDYQEIPSTELVHGKDLVNVLAEVFLAHNLSRDSAEPVLRTSFERSLVKEYPNLTDVYTFITL